MKKNVRTVLLIILGVALVSGGVLLATRWNKPLAESIAMPTRTDETTGQKTTQPTENVEAPLVTQSVEPTKVSPTSTYTPTQVEPMCGGPQYMYILAIGTDTEDENYLYGLADVIRIARVDFVTPKVTVMTIPRDMWVEIPDIIEAKRSVVPMQKINTAYFYGGEGMGYYDGPGHGPGLLARTIAYNYDLYVDHYVAVNMEVFEKIVDVMGGVDIYLDEPIDGRPKKMDDVNPYKQGQGYFPAGLNHLSGYDALSFVRIRDRYSEVIRSEHQTLVICAIKDKLTSPEIIKSVPRMITSLLDSMQTDLTISQISQLICLLPRLKSENLQFVRFPDEWMVQGYEYDARAGGDTFVWKIDIEDIKNYLDAFETDTIPPSTAAGTTCP